MWGSINIFFWHFLSEAILDFLPDGGLLESAHADEWYEGDDDDGDDDADGKDDDEQ